MFAMSQFSVFLFVGVVFFGLLFVIGLRLKTRLPGTVTIDIPDSGDPTRANRTKAQIAPKGFQFVPFDVKQQGVPLDTLGLPGDEELIEIERGGEKLLFDVREMSYHHIAQGKLAGLPYAVSF